METGIGSYALFVTFAFATVCSPGPGVVMTLSNALRHGMRGTIGGVLGIATGALAVAALSATGLGLLLAASSVAFTVLKLLGAGYLIYLAVCAWRAKPLALVQPAEGEAGFARRFLAGLSLQLTNPKAIFFFLAVFPQFIDDTANHATQFAALVLTYSGLVVLVHCVYAAFASRARSWLVSERGGRAMNRISGTAFAYFGISLALARSS